MDKLTTLLTIIGFDLVVFVVAFLLIRKKFASIGTYHRFIGAWNIVIVANIIWAITLVVGMRNGK